MNILFHPLEKKCHIKAEIEHSLQITDIVVWEAELADRERLNRFLVVPHVLLGAEIVDLEHFAVVCLEEVDKIRFTISICGGKTGGWESARNYTIGYVREI